MERDDLEDIKKNPHEFICNFFEDIFPHVGRNVFEFLSLVPVSLLIPDLDYFSTKIKMKMNVFFLANPGGAKSGICSQFAKITYYPIEGKSYTAWALEKEIENSPIFSLIIEDYSTMALDERINKIIEGIIGDERLLDRHTMKRDIRMNVEGVGLLCGVPYDLTDNLTTGLISRTLCVVSVHNEEEHSDIGDHIMKNIGKKSNFSDIYDKIKSYYDLLQKIQSDGDEEFKKKFPIIEGFEISDEIRKKIESAWDNDTKFYRKVVPFNFFREMQDGIRLLVAHAFFNYFNREKENGILKIKEEDCDVAIRLMRKNMATKYQVYMSEQLGRGVKSAQDFKKIMENDKIPLLTKKLIPFHVQQNIRNKTSRY